MKKAYKELLGVKKINERKSMWTKIGVAFPNSDGSWNLRFDYFPTDREMTIQLRDPRSGKDESEADDVETGAGVSA